MAWHSLLIQLLMLRWDAVRSLTSMHGRDAC